MGLKNQIAPWQSQISGEPGTFGPCWLFHHLHQNFLARLEQLRDPGRAFLQAKRSEISDMNKSVLLTFTNIDKRSINSRKNVLNGAEIDVTDLITTLSNDQLIDTFICEHSCNPQLLSDDNLLGHG